MRRYFLQHDRKAIDKAIKLYLKGFSIWEVGKLIGYSGQSVNRALKKLGVPRRHGIKPIGSTRIRRGRTYIRTEEGWKLRYREVAKKIYGEEAIKSKHVHHVNDDSLDDRPENLEPLTPSEHRSITNRSAKMRKAAGRGWAGRMRKANANLPEPS